MKKIVTIIAVMCVTLLSVNAQKWDLLHPVTVEKIRSFDNAKEGTSAWFFRINAAITATTFSAKFDENDQFAGLESGFLSKVGMGLSLAHYIDSDGQAVNNYSVNGLLLMPTDGETNVALAVTGSFYNINLGLGYDMVKGKFSHNIFGLFGVQIAF